MEGWLVKIPNAKANSIIALDSGNPIKCQLTPLIRLDVLAFGGGPSQGYTSTWSVRAPWWLHPIELSFFFGK